MKETIITRYKVRQKILKLKVQTNKLKKAEEILDNIITYKALLMEDSAEAKRFKKNHLDNRREGVFNLKVKNGLKVEIPILK